MTDNERKTDEVPSTTDPNALVQWVLRESYLEQTEDLRHYAEKVHYFNKQKKAIRSYLNALRKVLVGVKASLRVAGVDPCRDRASTEAEAIAIDQQVTEFPTDDITRELCIPDRVPPESVTTLDGLDAEIRRWEEQLNTIGDDAQLANVDLQNILQKQQQTLQMMSNISKMLHDTASSVIKKMGG